MTSETAPELADVAALYGVETAWLDSDGSRHTVPEETVRAVLSALGAPTADRTERIEAALSRRRAVWSRLCPPVVSVGEGRSVDVPLRVPAADAKGPLRWTITFEDGGGLSGTARLDQLSLAGGRRYESTRWEVRRLPLPPQMPPGYHRLDVGAGRRAGRSRLVVGPHGAWRGERIEGGWGVFHPLYGLRGAAYPGLADLADAHAVLEWCVAHGATVYGTTPLLASFEDPPVDPSPYAPVSRLFWNDAYLHLPSLPGWAQLSQADRELAQPQPGPIPWDDIMGRRSGVLSALADGFFDSGGARRSSDFQRWLARRPEASEYARFRAVAALHGRDWRTWPARVDAPMRDVRRHLFAQWQAARQIDGLAASSRTGLYLDIPLGTSADGYDVWRHRDQFVSGVSVGAPPDDFFPAGQDWGLPPPHPRAVREDGYEYFASVLRHSMRPASLVRIDHVMQVERLFWIPDGADPAEGTYVRYPAEEMASVIALESHMARTEVVGEDLGTVTTRVRELMVERRIRRSWVYGFDLKRTPTVPAGAVASIGTHDTFPLRGLRQARDVDARVRLGVLPEARASAMREERYRCFEELDDGPAPPDATAGPDPLLETLLRELAASPAGLVVVALDDLFGIADAQNVPGTTTEYPNWRRRLGDALHDLSPRALAALRSVAEVRQSRPGPTPEGKA